MYPQTNPYQPAPAWQPPRRWWQHPALIITLLVVFPPAGIALAWLGRWTTRTKVVASVLSGLWFLLILVSEPEKEKTPGDDPKPAVTASATATPTPTPTVEPTTESPTPEPTTEAPTPTPTPEPTTEPPTTKAPEPTTKAPTTQAPKPAPTTPKPTPKPVQTTQPPETAEPEPEPVYYANCDAVRAAGAAPIHVGDPGYSRKLDRDGDGVACE